MMTVSPLVGHGTEGIAQKPQLSQAAISPMPRSASLSCMGLVQLNADERAIVGVTQDAREADRHAWRRSAEC